MEQKKGLGLSLPIRNGQQGFFDTSYSTLENEKFKIMNLLMTISGERLFQPNIGVGLYKYLFDPIDSTLSNKLKKEIQSKIDYWLPNVKIVEMNVDITSGVDRNQIYISLKFTLKKAEYLSQDYEILTFRI